MENIKETLKKNCFPDYLKNAGYSDFINKNMGTIDKVAPIKKVTVKANWKPRFGREIMSGV